MIHRSGPPRTLTLEQVIVVFSITIVTVAAVLFSLDPMLHLRVARNMERWSEVNILGSALRAYREAHGGQLPPSIDRVSATVQIIGEGRGPCERLSCRGERIAWTQCQTPGLAEELRSYLSPLPVDPLRGTPEDTRYAINADHRGIVVISACMEEPEDLEGRATPPRIQAVW